MLLLQLFGLLSTRKGIFLDLPFDITGSIGKKNCRVGVATGHFALGALQWGEEFRVNECRLTIQRVTFGDQLMSNITGHAEVWVLVDGTWNQTGHVGIAAGPEHKRERRGEGWGGLNRWERNFPNVGSSVESKDPIDLWYRAQCDTRKGKENQGDLTKGEKSHLCERKNLNTQEPLNNIPPHLYLLSPPSKSERHWGTLTQCSPNLNTFIEQYEMDGQEMNYEGQNYVGLLFPHALRTKISETHH